MKNIILTGFEPFGRYLFNPTTESTKHFDGKTIEDYYITGIVLPCTYYGAFEILKKAIIEKNPEAIVSTGLSSSVKGIRFETIGRNIMKGKYTDANGYKPNNVKVVEGGDEFLETNADNLGLANLLSKNSIPTEMSADADSFVCNSLIYLTSFYLERTTPETKNVFIHTPWTDNYSSLMRLERNKIMIPQDVLYSSIEMIIRNV